jgi:hypothetical protein
VVGFIVPVGLAMIPRSQRWPGNEQARLADELRGLSPSSAGLNAVVRPGKRVHFFGAGESLRSSWGTSISSNSAASARKRKIGIYGQPTNWLFHFSPW